ncbi:MAG: queuosine salvage family protein [Candidatus Hermodarchaeota archaeon]
MDNSVELSIVQSQKLGRLLRELQPGIEDFLNPHLFPPQNVDPEEVARFFFFVTSIDHRTSPPGQSFEGSVDDVYFQGADLLWHLCLRMFQEDSHLFHPKEMANITTKKVENWFTVDQPKRVTIRNPEERAILLRNGGQLLMEKHQSSVLKLLQVANHRVTTEPNTHHPGFLQLLSEFKAYEDPANKKSFLFLKFLLRRNLWEITDSVEIQIPVDNHLTRIALRTGIVTVSSGLANALRNRSRVVSETDIVLRRKIGGAFSIVEAHAERSVLELDDFFWHFGRQCCLLDDPICVTGCTSKCYVGTNLLNVPCHGVCPLNSVCLAYENDSQRALVEPKLETWYY